MIEWLSNNSDALSVIANFGTLLIWFFYAQLLFNGYRRERRPRMLINKGVGGADLDAPCLICNMSKEPVFIQAILVDLETSAGVYSAPATDTDEGEIDLAKASIGQRTRQGPLESGQCIQINRFATLITRAAKVGGLELVNGFPADPDIEFRSLTVTVASIYGPEDDPFGAQRSFRLECDDRRQVRLTPMTIDTQRLSSRRDKRNIKKWLRDYI